MSEQTEKRLNGSLADWPYRKVFLTGATGLIGGQILIDLLEVPQIETVTCLVRPYKGKAGLERLSGRLEKSGLKEIGRASCRERV